MLSTGDVRITNRETQPGLMKSFLEAMLSFRVPGQRTTDHWGKGLTKCVDVWGGGGVIAKQVFPPLGRQVHTDGWIQGQQAHSQPVVLMLFRVDDQAMVARRLPIPVAVWQDVWCTVWVTCLGCRLRQSLEALM